MKARGVFAIFAKVALACAMYVKDVFKTHSHSTGGNNRGGLGRDAFMNISQPRCHTQKKIFKGFAK